ncbi:hypothetical protein [Listeria booriae]|uniref:hypothetical protein n=1 Tax=Listeria booriae TaxID=1552123 RepID=UPI00164E526B|nr:hypothetical protein [Listeria booriae]MBC6299443.1 hypothetical protein [Listeria booriae]
MINGKFKNTAFEFSASIPENLKSKCCENELYNQPDLLFLEDKYIIESSFFSKVIAKLKVKEFNEHLKLYKDNSIIAVDDYSLENNRYEKIITENNINGINKNDLNISVRHFSLYEKDCKINFLQNIYILILIANITDFKDNSFEFKVKLDDKETIKHISFDSIESLNLLQIYNWIMLSEENLFTRLRIVREIILNKGSFELIDIDLESAKSAFNRIIKEETNKYFEQINILKDDFLILSERKQESYNSLHLKFLGWCSAIVIFIYDILKDQHSDQLVYKLFRHFSEKVYLFLIIFIISLIMIWLVFIKEMRDYNKEYEKIENFYTKKLFFEENDFHNYIPAPKIPKIYTISFILLLIVLFLRLFI